MWITSKTIITFLLPEEYETMQSFIRDNDMSEWERQEDSRGITFVKVEYYSAGGSEEGDVLCGRYNDDPAERPSIMPPLD